MSISTQDYAALADHSYGRDREGRTLDHHALIGKTTSIEGVMYRVLAHADRPSGYQGTVYQRVDSGEIVVAHRGTEFERQKVDDLVRTDGGMVVRRDNRQADDAITLTREALQLSQDYASRTHKAVPQVTVTGHSLGGTLAQVSAHYFDLRGETFNAYGAASLNLRNPSTGEVYRLPEGGNAVTNHVMAADLVSAGSPHYGQVRVYTNAREIDTLQRHGYDNQRGGWDLRRDTVAAVAAMRGGSHDMHNFLPWDGDNRPDTSILAEPVARRLANTFDPMIDKFREDIGGRRSGLTVLLRDGPGLIEDVRQHLRDPLPAGAPARAAAASRERADAPPIAPAMAPRAQAEVRDPSDARHPLHARYCTAYAGVCAVDQAHGRTPDAGSVRIAAALAAESTPLADIAGVMIGTDKKRMFAVDTLDANAPVRNRVHVDIATAYQQPLEASHDRWEALTTQAAQRAQVAQVQAQVQDEPAARMVRSA